MKTILDLTGKVTGGKDGVVDTVAAALRLTTSTLLGLTPLHIDYQQRRLNCQKMHQRNTKLFKSEDGVQKVKGHLLKSAIKMTVTLSVKMRMKNWEKLNGRVTGGRDGVVDTVDAALKLTTSILLGQMLLHIDCHHKDTNWYSVEDGAEQAKDHQLKSAIWMTVRLNAFLKTKLELTGKAIGGKHGVVVTADVVLKLT